MKPWLLVLPTSSLLRRLVLSCPGLAVASQLRYLVQASPFCRRRLVPSRSGFTVSSRLHRFFPASPSHPGPVVSSRPPSRLGFAVNLSQTFKSAMKLCSPTGVSSILNIWRRIRCILDPKHLEIWKHCSKLGVSPTLNIWTRCNKRNSAVLTVYPPS